MTARKTATKKTALKAVPSSTKKAMTARKTTVRSSVTKKATRSVAKMATRGATKAVTVKSRANVSATRAKATTALRTKGTSTRAKATTTRTKAANARSAPTTATANRAGSRATAKTPKIPAGKAPAKLSSQDSKHFEKLLLGEREKLMREMGHLENNVLNRSMREAGGELSGYSFHMADIGTDSMEREKAFLFASTEGRALIEVNDALHRLYNGQYGECEVCTETVGKERLEVVPDARLCVSCKENEERSQAGRVR